MSAKGFLIDATSRNAVFVQRLAGGEYKKILERLNSLERQILGIVAQTDISVSRQTAALLEVQRAAAEAFQQIAIEIGASADETATYLAEFTKRMMDQAATVEFEVPTEETLQRQVAMANLNSARGLDGLTIQQALQQYGDTKAGEISRVLTGSFIPGMDKNDTVKAVSALMGNQKRQAETLVRTTTNAAAQAGRMATFVQNDEYLQGYEWISVLDHRTTLICAGLDGDIYEFGQGPMPPAHWGCRSQIVASLIPRYQDKGLEGERNAENGKITANTTYPGWLKKQPASFQDEALGVERAKLFRSGGLSIDKFTDDNFNIYTLDQLMALEPLAFERAGLT